MSFEDNVAAFNHGSLISDFDKPHDQSRIEKSGSMEDIFNPRVDQLLQAGWREIAAMYSSIRQHDSVKMVVIDLDDTLWRGVIADTDVHAMPTREGWPVAFWEALLILKRRGIFLGIISKNEETRVREVWPAIMGKAGPAWEDFAAYRINWLPKSKNMADILAAVNLLPNSVVYIDDNPANRAEMKEAFPAIRVLGGTPALWRHILLWAPETQSAAITDESVARTQMIQAQIAREEERKTLSAEEFLASLGVKMSIFSVKSADHPRFPRVIELINKTNQFNTTGRRWSQEECLVAFSNGVDFLAFEVSDRFSDYGLVGVLIVDQSGIQQFVMSCRIMGLDAEYAAIAYVAQALRRKGAKTMFGAMIDTERNLPCRDIYRRSGFMSCEGGWMLDLSEAPAMPAHIALTVSINLLALSPASSWGIALRRER